MKNKIKYIALALFVLYTAGLCAQNTTDTLYGDLRDYNLKGPVKSIKLMYTYVNPKIDKDATKFKISNEIYFGRYLKFNRYGYQYADLADVRHTINDPIDTTNVSVATYSDTERQKKAKLVNNGVPYPAYNYMRINLSKKLLSKIDKNDTDPETLYLPYEYITDNTGKVIKEISYNALEDYDIKPVDTMDVSQWTEYIYDAQNRLVRQNIFPGKINTLPFSGNYHVHNISIPHSAKSHRTFAYDAQGRLVNVSFYINGAIGFEEIYTYDKNTNHITTVNRFAIINPVYPFYPASKMKLSYNKYNDVTEVVYYPEGNEEWPVHNRYYEYTYDKHNNWITCKLSLLGSKKEATLIAKREIEYYKN